MMETLQTTTFPSNFKDLRFYPGAKACSLRCL